MKARLCIAATVILTALFSSNAGAQNGLQSLHPQVALATTCTNRIAIFLDGYGSSSGDVAPDFSDILTKSLAGLGYSDYKLFSYRWQAEYSGADTYTALPSGGPSALHSLVSSILSSCSGASIDLIGFSLGGAVAFDYMSLYGLNTAEGSHIKHMVTLDSPVNGDSQSAIAGFADLFHIPALGGSQTGMVLQREASSPNTVHLNAALIYRLQGKTSFQTISSTGDLVVPSIYAEVGPTSEFSLGRDLAACPSAVVSWSLYYAGSCLGHYQVLHDPRALTAVQRALSTSVGPGWSASLAASTTSAMIGNTVTLTAQTNKTLDGTGNSLSISVPGAPTIVSCSTGTTCPTSVISAQPATIQYVALVKSSTGKVIAQSSPISVTWIAPPPSVTGVSPSSGPSTGGTSVTITGANFMGTTGVMFGATAATSFTVNSATQITAISPPESAATVDVTVMTPGGASVISSSDRFTYSAGQAGTITEFPIPAANSDPMDITAGPDGNLWFGNSGVWVGRITPLGTITEFPIPTAYGNPFDITAGPDGNLWFTEHSTNQIGRISP